MPPLHEKAGEYQRKGGLEKLIVQRRVALSTPADQAKRALQLKPGCRSTSTLDRTEKLKNVAKKLTTKANILTSQTTRVAVEPVGEVYMIPHQEHSGDGDQSGFKTHVHMV